jgi:hypothetical protein
MRGSLKAVVEGRIEAIWPQGSTHLSIQPRGAAAAAERLAVEVRGLKPRTDEETWLKSRATDLAESLLEVRFRVVGRVGSSVPTPFLVILVFWITVTFVSYGLFAPRTATVLAVMFLCSTSIATAVFLVLELDAPLEGLIRVPPDPLVAVLAMLNR